MSWLIIIFASVISAAIILYALWPTRAGHTSRKTGVVLLAVTALILPSGLNYYNGSSERETPNDRIFSGKLPDMKKSVWSGGTTQMPTSVAKDMSMSGVTARLEAKLKNNPNDINGWILLGRAYAALGASNKAISLFQDKIREHPDNINLLVSYGETLTQFEGGIIPEEAKNLFQKAHSLDSAHPRAESNLARYDMQNNQNKQAYDRLKTLLDSAPEKAPWRAEITEQMTLAAQKTGIISQQPDPTPEQMAAANGLSQEDRNAFIRSMVDNLAHKLKENPKDLQGWLRLGKSYDVLEEWQKASAAYKQAMTLKPKDKTIKKLYDNAAARATLIPAK